jgi:hypothetical protein
MSETFLNQFIVGTLLGDSFITKDGRFGFAHSKVQEEYFNHKVDMLTEYGMPPKIHSYKTKGNQYKSWYIKPVDVLKARVCSLKRWGPLRELWYPAEKKIVPATIELDAVALAYWYMDDGSVNKRTKFTDNREGRATRTGGPWVNQFRLHLDGFDHQSQELLQQKLLDLGIESWFYTKKDSSNRNLLITKDQSKKQFKELVFPVMEKVPSMLYKIDIETSFKL